MICNVLIRILFAKEFESSDLRTKANYMLFLDVIFLQDMYGRENEYTNLHPFLEINMKCVGNLKQIIARSKRLNDSDDDWDEIRLKAIECALYIFKSSKILKEVKVNLNVKNRNMI